MSHQNDIIGELLLSQDVSYVHFSFTLFNTVIFFFAREQFWIRQEVWKTTKMLELSSHKAFNYCQNPHSTNPSTRLAFCSVITPMLLSRREKISKLRIKEFKINLSKKNTWQSKFVSLFSIHLSISSNDLFIKLDHECCSFMPMRRHFGWKIAPIQNGFNDASLECCTV